MRNKMRWIALLLAVVMCIGILPISAFAEKGENGNEANEPSLTVTSEPIETEAVTEPEPAGTEDDGLETNDVPEAQGGDGLYIENVQAVVVSGATLNGNNHWVKTPINETSGQEYTIRVNYSFNGLESFDAGEVEFLIPIAALKNLNGEAANSITLSVPEASDGGLSEENPLVYEYSDAGIRIYNRVELDSSQFGYFEVTYATSERTFEYQDYDPEHPELSAGLFQVDLTVRQGGASKTASNAIALYMDTSAVITRLEKHSPTLYYEWDSAWGEEPADAADYYYLVWEVCTWINATQTYDFRLEDNFDFEDGSLVGYKLSGARVFSDEVGANEAENIKTNCSVYNRYDYVLTRHLKSTYDPLLERDGRYSLKNEVTAYVTPTGGADAENSRTAEQNWTHREGKYAPPPGYFWSEKWGKDFSGYYHSDSNGAYAASYALTELADGRIDEISGLGFYAYVYGFLYRFTYNYDGDGEAPDINDEASKDYYGKLPVLMRITDNTLALESVDGSMDEDLEAEDYRIDSLKLSYQIYECSYSETTKEYSKGGRTSGTIELYVELNGEWIDAATLTPDGWEIKRGDVIDSADYSGYVANVKFKNEGSNVTGYRFETYNSQYYTRLDTYPEITLIGTDKVKAIANAVANSDDPRLVLVNKSQIGGYLFKAFDGNTPTFYDEPFYEHTEDKAEDFIYGASRTGTVSKRPEGAYNDVVNRSYIITWSGEVEERAQNANGAVSNVKQASGVFYDLIPQGGDYVNNSVTVFADGTKLDGNYTVSIITDYKGSGRTLVVIRINESAYKYSFTYQTIHSWDSIKEHGTDVRNLLAYETGNEEIGGGYPDNGGTLDGNDRLLLTDLDPDTDAKRFIYDSAYHNISAITSGSLGLYKRVKTENDDVYKASSIVFSGKQYSYRIRFATDSTTRARDLIVYDSIENYVKSSGAVSDWHGTLTGIDLSVPVKLGIAPVIYYSTEILDIEANRDLESGAWTKCENIGSLPFNEVKTIAIDLRKATDGTDFVLPAGKSVSIFLFMHSPSDAGTETLNVEAYNSVWLQSAIDNSFTGEYTPRFESFEYTTLVYRAVGSFKIHKVDANDEAKNISGVRFRLFGKSIYNSDIDIAPKTNGAGCVLFTDVEAGTYTLQEVDGRSDYLQDHTELKVTIGKDGSVVIEGEFTHGSFTKVADGEYKATNIPRVSGDLKFYKKGAIDGADGLFGLRGAKFVLSGESYYGDQLSWSAESQADGSVEFKDVDRGSSYELREIAAPEGYILSDTVYRVVCDANGLVTIEGVEKNAQGEMTIINESYHSLKLYKYDSKTLQPLEGAAFILTGTINGTAIELEQESGEGGVVSFGKLEAGSYVLTEKEAPEHYAKDETQRLVTVGRDGSVTVDGLEYSEDIKAFLCPNERLNDGVITITKVWSNAEAGEVLPIPTVHVSSTVPKYELPSATADAHAISVFTVDMKSFGPAAAKPDDSILAGATEIQTADSAYKVYIWDAGDGDARWWSPAPKVYLSDDCEYMFCNIAHRYVIGENGTTEVNNITHPELLIVDLTGFDTSKITSVSGMFCSYYDQRSMHINLSTFDFSNVVDMSRMFGSLTISSNIIFPFKAVTAKEVDMAFMFTWSHITDFDFSRIDVSRAKNMASMFSVAKGTSLDLSAWDTSKVEDMSYMFSQACFDEINLGGNFSTESVINMEQMFYQYGGWSHQNDLYDGVEWEVKLDLSNFNTSKVTNMSGMFSDFPTDFSKVTLPEGFGFAAENMDQMFRYYKGTSLDLKNLNTSSCTTMVKMFEGNWYLKELNISCFSTEKVTNMKEMFCDCYLLERLDISSFVTQNLETCQRMFAWAGSQLISEHQNNPDSPEFLTVYVGPKWDLSNVENDSSMLSFASGLKGSKGTVYNGQNPDDKTYAHADEAPENPGYFWYKDPADSSGGGGTNVTAMLASPARRLMLDAAEAVDLVSVGEMYEGGGDTSEVYDQWIDNGDGTWTYRFLVADEAATYYVYEGPVAGFTGDYTAEHYYTLEYEPGETNAVTITNTKNTDDTTGSLTVVNRVAGVPTDKEFKYTVEFDDAGVNIFGVNSDFEIIAGRGEFTLRTGERTTITGLPANVGYTVTETETNGYTVSVSGGDITGEDSLTSNVADTPVVTFTNRKNQAPAKGTLIITKTVECAEGVAIGKDEGRSFVFTLQLTGREIPEAGAVFGGLAFENGATSFLLKDGESITVSGIPGGTSYVVTEETASGFTAAAENERGTITAGETVTCAYTNTKTENDRTGGFSLSKSMAAGSESAESFTFIVELAGLDANVEYRYGNESFIAPQSGRMIIELSLAGGESVSFEGLPAGSACSITEKANAYVASCLITDAEGEARRAANAGAMTDLSTGTFEIADGGNASISFTNSGAAYSVSFAKYGEAEDFVAGAVLRVVDALGRTAAEWTSGTELTVKELSAGSYRLIEVEAPAGYIKSGETVAFTVGNDGSVTVNGENASVVSLTNRRTSVSVLKTDNNGAALEGALLRIVDSDNTTVASFTSATEAKVFSGLLRVGVEYTLIETRAPEGYKKAENIKFSLTEEGELLVNGEAAERVQMIDEPETPGDPPDDPPDLPDDPPVPPPPPPPPPTPIDNYSIIISESTEGNADKAFAFDFEIELSHETEELPMSIEVEGSRYPNGGKLEFAVDSVKALNNAGTGSGTASIKAKIKLADGEEIKLKGLPDGTKIRIVQSGGDENWIIKIDGVESPDGVANRTVTGSDVKVSYTNVYKDGTGDVPPPAPPDPPDPHDPPEPSYYSITITETVEGRDEEDNDEFEFEIILMHGSVELPAAVKVEGSRYPNGETLEFTVSGDREPNSSGTGSGTSSIKAKIKLSAGEKITLKGLPDGTEIWIIQAAKDEHWTTQIDGVDSADRTARKTIAGSDVTVSYTNIYDENIPGSNDPLEHLPDTGDNSNFGLWLTIAILSVLGLAMLVNRRKRMN